ncbi:uncharacterized protein LOC62_07G009717 [Vanrija pseudolonga]|uniref:Uncharacterized protein n=1 Tax=Vanrija pseudolonga TaxID=143232 RepID=A0AAF1BMG5_9TREE|nr:hypothetical protein LOC62_07G009717 [Vanrija pseudolonga]
MFKTEPARQAREQDQDTWYIPLSIDTSRGVSDPETSPVPATFSSPTSKPPTPQALPLGAAKSPKSAEGPWWNRLVKKDEGKAGSNKRWSRSMDAFVGGAKKYLIAALGAGKSGDQLWCCGGGGG